MPTPRNQQISLSDTVLRNSKKGNNAGNKFLGRSFFPKCRTIINIT